MALGSDGPNGFSFDFLDLFHFLIFLLTWREHAWAPLASIELVRLCGCVWCVQSHNCLVRPCHRETAGGPELTRQWTLAAVVCAALAGVFKKRM